MFVALLRRPTWSPKSKLIQVRVCVRGEIWCGGFWLTGLAEFAAEDLAVCVCVWCAHGGGLALRSLPGRGPVSHEGHDVVGWKRASLIKPQPADS